MLGVVAGSGFGGDEYCSGERDESELGRFAGVAERLVEAAEAGVCSRGSDGGHVEGVTDALAAAANRALAGEGAAVMVVRGKAGQCGGGLG